MNGLAPHHALDVPNAPVKPRRRRSPAAQPAPKPHDAAWYDLSKRSIIGWFVGAIITMAGAGWLTLPAKQSDVEDIKVAVERFDAQFKAIGAKIESLTQVVASYREEVVRLTTMEEVRAQATPSSSPAPRPVARAVRQKPSIKTEEKPFTLFGSGF